MEKSAYQTNLKALTFGECRRMGGGLVKGGFFWLIARFAPPSGRLLLPQLQEDVTARREELSALVLEKLDGPRLQLEQRGYAVAAYQRLKEPPNPDAGGLVALSPDHRKVAFVNFIRQPPSAPGAPAKEVLELGLQCFFEDEGSAGISNHTEGLDPHPGCRAALLRSSDFAVFEARLERLVAGDSARVATLRGPADVALFLDREELATFADRIGRRKLFVPAPPEAAAPPRTQEADNTPA